MLRHRPVDARPHQLGVVDATAMGIGGMIGGGIFSVLGLAIGYAGHLAFACFLLGAVLAAATARSYAGIAERAPEAVGAVAQLREGGTHVAAGILVWLLLVGYVMAMGVYSFTFGHYAADALGVPVWGARVASIAVLVAFLGVNLAGVKLSARVEDAIVALKVLILLGIAAVGLAHTDVHRLAPLADKGVSGLILGAGAIFVAYEGFELISYDRADLADPARTLPRSLYWSVGIVALVYVSVTLGSQMLLSDARIVAGKEVAFAELGQAAIGPAGRWLAILGAVLATSSAINATLFSGARLVRDASAVGDLPPWLGAERIGLPVRALALVSIGGGVMAMLPGLTEVISFASASFLVVFAFVNQLQARHAATRAQRIVGAVATAACIGALGAVVVGLAQTSVASVVAMAVVAAAVVGAKVGHDRRHPPTATRGS